LGRSPHSFGGGGYHATNAISVEKRYTYNINVINHNPSHTNLNFRCYSASDKKSVWFYYHIKALGIQNKRVYIKKGLMMKVQQIA